MELAPAHTPGESPLRITAMIYETPPTIVSVVSGGPDGKGNIVGRQIGGMVTSQFPNATVFLKLGGPTDFTDETIRDIIKKNFLFKCGDVLSQGLSADLIGKIAYSFQDGKLGKIDSGTIPANKPEARSSEAPRLNLELISKQDDRWIIALKCEVATNLDNLSGKSPVLLDQLIGVRPAEPILIGFPFVDSQKYRFIYWVALFMEES
jgi:hypothetical protein